MSAWVDVSTQFKVIDPQLNFLYGILFFWLVDPVVELDLTLQNWQSFANSGVSPNSTGFLPNNRVDRINWFLSFQNSYNIHGHPAHSPESFVRMGGHMGRSDKIF
jgi:hypothetical protein